MLLRQVATDGLEQVVAALQRPDDPPPPEGTYCDLIGHGPLAVLLADGAGHYLHPRAPTSDCGAPEPEVTAALKALDWRTVSITRLERARSPEPIASGCEMRWKNELGLEGSYLDPSDGGPLFADREAGNAVKVCLYRVTDDPDAGTLTRAVTVDGVEADQLMAAGTGPGPVQPCSAPTRFAVFHVAHDWLNVELGGCWQVLRHDGVERRPHTMRVLQSIGSADPAALTTLLSLR